MSSGSQCKSSHQLYSAWIFFKNCSFLYWNQMGASSGFCRSAHKSFPGKEKVRPSCRCSSDTSTVELWVLRIPLVYLQCLNLYHLHHHHRLLHWFTVAYRNQLKTWSLSKPCQVEQFGARKDVYFMNFDRTMLLFRDKKFRFPLPSALIFTSSRSLQLLIWSVLRCIIPWTHEGGSWREFMFRQHWRCSQLLPGAQQFINKDLSVGW